VDTPGLKRGERPFVFAQVKAGQGVAEVAAFIEKAGGLRGVKVA
jgi:hypothetical protein